MGIDAAMALLGPLLTDTRPDQRWWTARYRSFLRRRRERLERGPERVHNACPESVSQRAPAASKLLDQVRPGDTVVVWRLDRLGRSLHHLIDTVNALAERKVGFRSLTENIDTTTSSGKLVFHIFGALAEFERELIRAPRPGLAAARARGRHGGRPTG